MKSISYIDMVIDKYGLKNDKQICDKFGWSSARMSQYRTGKNVMDNEACGQIALALGIDPMKVIMAADLDRAAKAGQKSFWETSKLKAQRGFVQTNPIAAVSIIAWVVTVYIMLNEMLENLQKSITVSNQNHPSLA